MKKLMFIIMVILSGIAYGQTTWISLLDAGGKDLDILDMKLVKYGLYENGREVNTYYPSAQNGNAGEKVHFSCTRNKNTFCMVWSNTQDGSVTYYGTIDGAYLRINEKEKNGKKISDNQWIKILWYKKHSDEDYFDVMTVSNNNTYRLYNVEVTSNDVDLFKLLLGL